MDRSRDFYAFMQGLFQFLHTFKGDSSQAGPHKQRGKCFIISDDALTDLFQFENVEPIRYHSSERAVQDGGRFGEEQEPSRGYVHSMMNKALFGIEYTRQRNELHTLLDFALIPMFKHVVITTSKFPLLALRAAPPCEREHERELDMLFQANDFHSPVMWERMRVQELFRTQLIAQHRACKRS